MPDNLKLVWVRRLPFYDTPVRATWDTTSGASVVITVAGTPINQTTQTVPWVLVHSWKFQFKADEDAYQAARGPDDPH